MAIFIEIPIEIIIDFRTECHAYLDAFNEDAKCFKTVEELIRYVKSRACDEHRYPLFHARVIIYERKEYDLYKIFDSERSETYLDEVLRELKPLLEKELKKKYDEYDEWEWSEAEKIIKELMRVR